jgi:hypothetical protein
MTAWTGRTDENLGRLDNQGENIVALMTESQKTLSNIEERGAQVAAWTNGADAKLADISSQGKMMISRADETTSDL